MYTSIKQSAHSGKVYVLTDKNKNETICDVFKQD